MREERLRALIAAVYRTIREQVANGGRRPPGYASTQWWPLVAIVISHLTGEQWTGEQCRRQHRTARENWGEDGLQQRADDVAPGDYSAVVDYVLEHGNVPDEKAPAALPPDGQNEKPEKEWAPPPARSDDFRDRVDYRKQEILWQHDRKVAKDLVEQKSLTELLVEAVERGAQEAPPVIWRPAPAVLVKPEAVEEVPVALLSDIHVGTLVNPEEMGGLGEYNFEILKRRLDNYQTRITQAIDLHRRDAKIRRMVVYMLGDMVEGEVIFDGQAMRIELITVDQLFEGASYIEGWLLGLLNTGLVEEIHVVCIYGNHGRTTHKKGASKAHSNWDYVMYRHMARVLRNEPRIKWFIPKAWFALLGIFDWRIYGTHGDTIKSWMGIPFYGIQRHDMRTTTLLQSVGVDYHYMVYGDKHITATIPRVVGAQIMNGSTVGGSDFSMHQLGTASEPMQTVFGINERHGKTWQYDCVLDRRDPDEIRKHLAFAQI